MKIPLVAGWMIKWNLAGRDLGETNEEGTAIVQVTGDGDLDQGSGCVKKVTLALLAATFNFCLIRS